MSALLDVQSLTTDVLVIGGGVAALRAAIAAREAGSEVTVCCKGIAGRSGNTVVSTADISAYVPDLGIDDSEDTFAADTLESGASIADERLVHLLAEHSGAAVLDLERLGIHLLRADGQIDRTRAAGHSRARTYRADATGLGPNKGLALSVPLAATGRGLGVRFLNRTPVIEFIVEGGLVQGALAVDLESGAVLRIAAGAVVLAAGGAGHLFARTNSTGDATGDATAMALRAGAVGRDLEFVQWHPTRMDEPVSLFLTNGLLADGGVFRDAAGREFMTDYDDRGNLAPRDVLAKAVYLEIAAERGKDGGVYLDCSAIPADRIALRHAYLAETLQKHGVDFPAEPVVVSPATHFMMGGIAIDEKARSSLEGLFVAGESAAGIHGANRLGGNAFCEGLVFGTIAGKGAAHLAQRVSAGVRDDHEVHGLGSALEADADDSRGELSDLWHHLRREMWEDASLVRSAASLGRAAGTITALCAEAERLKGPDARAAARIVELRSALECAEVIVATAAFREESRGAHWRSDFPEPVPGWFGHVSVSWPAAEPHPILDFKAKGETA